MHTAPAAIFAFLLSACTHCIAQQEPCGLRTMTETTKPVYPPIARAAHVEDVVVMLVTFKLNGEVEKIDVVSGPKMLQPAATSYVQGWRANEFSGPRTCPIAVRFVMFHPGDNPAPRVVREDLQHITIHDGQPFIEP